MAAGAIMIRIDWIESIEKLTSYSEQVGEIYTALFKAARGLEWEKGCDKLTKAIVTMILPALRDDAAKYEAKCEKNRQNALARASERKRTQANASERKRTQANASEASESLYNTNTNNNNNTNTNNNPIQSISQPAAQLLSDREKFDIYSIFFNRGAVNVEKISNDFINYYEALGWRNNKGAAIQSKQAAARMWSINGELCANIKERGIWYAAMRNANTTNTDIWTTFITMRIGEEDGKKKAFLYLTRKETAKVLENECMGQLVALAKQLECELLGYEIRPSGNI